MLESPGILDFYGGVSVKASLLASSHVKMLDTKYIQSILVCIKNLNFRALLGKGAKIQTLRAILNV